MNIGYYFAYINPTYGGIYQYALLILKMFKKADNLKIYLFYSKEQEEILSEFKEHPNFKLVLYNNEKPIRRLLNKIANFFLNRYYLRGLNEKYFLKLYNFFHPDKYYFNRFPLDLLHVPWQLSNVYHLKFPVATTMHDLQQMYFPEFFTPLQRLYKNISYYQALNESDYVIVSYEHVAKDISKYFDINNKVR
jgi:hypothetical protein